MKRWACFSIFEVKVAILAPSIALFGIILFLSDSNIFGYRFCTQLEIYYKIAFLLTYHSIKKRE